MITGGLGLIVSVLVSLVVLGARLAGYTHVPGYTATMLCIAYFGCLNAELGLPGERLLEGFHLAAEHEPAALADALKSGLGRAPHVSPERMEVVGDDGSGPRLGVHGGGAVACRAGPGQANPPSPEKQEP
jgi:hypothetical protein